jgi:hypothetical protein
MLQLHVVRQWTEYLDELAAREAFRDSMMRLRETAGRRPCLEQLNSGHAISLRVTTSPGRTFSPDTAVWPVRKRIAGDVLTQPGEW